MRNIPKHTSFYEKNDNESGMTLVELVVATTLGIIISTIVFQFFIIQISNFRENREAAEMQQELRWGINYVAERLRLAGNGVPSMSGFEVLENYDNIRFGSDSLVVIGSFKSLVVTTTQNMGNEGSQIKVDNGDGVENYDLIVISYPANGWQEMFMCTKIASDLHIYHDAYPPWNPTNKLSHKYPAGSIVTVVSQYNFFVDQDDEGRTNLMVLLQGPYGPQVLIDDIDSFQVDFKLKDGSWDAEPYDMNDIRLIEVLLRSKSSEEIYGYTDPEYSDGYKRLELKTHVIPKNIVLVAE